jgi:predicted dehydrogenase
VIADLSSKILRSLLKVLKVLLIGAGRMGLRHLRGVAKEADEISIVYHRRNIDKEVRQVLDDCEYKGKLNVVSSIEMAADRGSKFDAAILSATAEKRAKRFEKVIALDIAHILIEKPLEQSRENVLKIQTLANQAKSDIRCNNVFREQPIFGDFCNADATTQMTVNAGAIGLGCGGIHWIDLALYLSGGEPGQFVCGKLDHLPIGSGRGEQFKDFGGYGLFEFGDGFTLYLRVEAASSASVVCVITQGHRQLVIDHLSGVSVHQRKENANHPNYLYGQGYVTHQVSNFLNMDASAQTRLWLQHVKGVRRSKLPTLKEAVRGHKLLFDLLETNGAKNFPIT